jgi:AraC family transcriptional regulator of adaptative response/methylated-DNA-[protein]-cysteine methyltransferase
MRLTYTIVDCALGRMLVAATERGISALSLGDGDAMLEAELAKDYPKAEIHKSEIHKRELHRDRGLPPGEWIDALLDYLDCRSRDLSLPLDVEATGFQRRVWDALQAIPYGNTRTYGEIARSLGYSVTAARAVGHACATNPVSLVIPCHRAVRNDGGLGGYRWGLERKRALLDRERSAERLFI